jgi:hypothetical protein
MAAASVCCYYRIAYRVRGWGSLPMRRGPTLLVANHQHDIESAVVVADQTFRSLSWRFPIFTVSSRRMWEPGFFAERIPWLRIARTVNAGGLFSAIGLQPIENELAARPFVSVASAVVERHGDVGVQEVFRERALERMPPGIRTMADILDPAHFAISRTVVKLNDLLEPYRSELVQITRNQLDADVAHFERLVRDGATVFLTPEGFYSADGKMQRLRGILARLSPLATIWLAGISYEPYFDRRLTMFYRVRAASEDVPLDLQLKATRPVTGSALLCTWLASRRSSTFTFVEACDAVARALSELPDDAFVVPELRTRLDATVRSILGTMQRFGTLRFDGRAYRVGDSRRHPQFPRTADMIAYQANFHAETLEGLLRKRSGDNARG